MSGIVLLWSLAAASFAGFVVLGLAVSRRELPYPLDRVGLWRGTATKIALFFTLTGRAVPLLALGVLTIVASAIFKTYAVVAIAILVTQGLSQTAAELAKRCFLRKRPDAWIVHNELGHSYPSGHCTTAIVFFGCWLIATLASDWALPAKITICGVLAVWIGGILWSRMALAAHYPTDVAGGVLFGVAWASALWAVLLQLYVPA